MKPKGGKVTKKVPAPTKRPRAVAREATPPAAPARTEPAKKPARAIKSKPAPATPPADRVAEPVTPAPASPKEREPSETRSVALTETPKVPTPPAPVHLYIPSLDADEDPGSWIPIEEGDAAIPPLPDEDEFEPIPEDEEESQQRQDAPPNASPREILDGVRRGALHVSALSGVSEGDLADLAKSVGLPVRVGERRNDLLTRLLEYRSPPPPATTSRVEGLLEVLPDGYGFLRRPDVGYVAGPDDPYVSVGLVREFRMQTGHWVAGTARSAREGERYPALLDVEEINHDDPVRVRSLVPFEQLVVTHPDQRFLLETEPEEVTARILDLFCPLGRGQRALIVSPPRAGKTVILQKLADSLARNSPEVELVVLLLDERPEEVTNMRRSIRGEVIASTFDQPAHRHIRIAELAMEKVKRMVEFGRHVVLLIDSLTRLGRAYNNETGGAGRLLTGGLEATALTKPKRFFGAARNIEHGGSLTIIATALVDTGSRLDQVIFEEFKGSGNMEIVLDRNLSNLRLYPAIDIPKSGTRKEELLLHPEEQRRITALRRAMTGQEPPEALTDILSRMAKHRTNAEFLMNVEV